MQFDREDQDLAAYTWAHDRWGSYRYQDREKIYAHRVVAARLVMPKDLTARYRVRFVNGDKSDCRRSNILIFTPRQLMQRMRSSKSSRFRGVTWNTDRECWDVKLYRKVGGKPRTVRIGSFPLDQEEDAARAYDAYARRVLKHPIVNFPESAEVV